MTDNQFLPDRVAIRDQSIHEPLFGADDDQFHTTIDTPAINAAAATQRSDRQIFSIDREARVSVENVSGLGRRTPSLHDQRTGIAPDPEPQELAMEATIVDRRPDGQPTFEAMLSEEMPGLRARCRHLTTNPADADDLMQDVLLRAFRAYDRFDGRYPKAWLYTIARNTHLSNVHALRKIEPCDPSTLIEREHGDDGRETSIEGILRADTAEELRRAIDALEPSFREIAQLALIEGRSMRAVAEALDIPYGTVLSRLYRARQRLRMLLHHQQLVADARF